MMASPLRHIPASHPLVRSRPDLLERLVVKDPAAARETLIRVEHAREDITDALDQLAAIVVQLPNLPFSVEQRRSGMVIARELHRRSREPAQVDRDRWYTRAAHPEVEQRHATIVAAVAADPRRSLTDIAREFGVSRQLVSRLAIARGVSRRMRTSPVVHA